MNVPSPVPDFEYLRQAAEVWLETEKFKPVVDPDEEPAKRRRRVVSKTIAELSCKLDAREDMRHRAEVMLDSVLKATYFQDQESEFFVALRWGDQPLELESSLIDPENPQLDPIRSWDLYRHLALPLGTIVKLDR